MDTNMLIVERGGSRFFYRAVAVILDSKKDRILAHRVGDNPYWSLPGGRVELGESAQDAVIREMQEELGIATTAQRLLWVVENFFSYKTVPQHELGMYFLVDPQDLEALLSRGEEFLAVDGDTRLTFRWFARGEVASLDLFPRFLKSRLLELPDSAEYFVHRDKP